MGPCGRERSLPRKIVPAGAARRPVGDTVADVACHTCSRDDEVQEGKANQEIREGARTLEACGVVEEQAVAGLGLDRASGTEMTAVKVSPVLQSVCCWPPAAADVA